MSQAFGHDLRRNALAKQDRRRCVPQVVQPYARHALAPDKALKCRAEVVGVSWRTVGTRKHQVAVPVCRSHEEGRARRQEAPSYTRR